MAEIQTNSTIKKRGVSKCKKLSTRVDLTPMVDLGFLLITFFIFTTTLSTPQITSLVMPADDNKNPIEIPKSKVMQILVGKNDQLIYYFGDTFETANTTNFSTTGFRQLILEKQVAVAKKYGNKKEMILLIKPLNECNYKNIIDILDEVQINGITRYVFTEPSQNDILKANTLL